MPAQRTADDKFLALLARMPAPMELGEIGEALGWSKQRASQVASGLAAAGRIVRVDGERDGTTGKPPANYYLPENAPKPGEPRLLPLGKHTLVVTPSGEEARVVGEKGKSFAEIEYVTGPERGERATLHIRLLRAFQPGRDRPQPVRIVAPAKEAA